MEPARSDNMDLLSLPEGAYLYRRRSGACSLDYEEDIHRIDRDSNIETDLLQMLTKDRKCLLILRLQEIYDIIVIELTRYTDFELKMQLGIYGWIFKHCRKNPDPSLIRKVLAENIHPKKIVNLVDTRNKSASPNTDYTTAPFISARLKDLST